MAGSEDIVKDTSSSIGSMLSRIGEFFNLFDLSFFISGAVSFAALAYWGSRHPTNFQFPSSTWVRALATILACYVCGLISFSAGRVASRLWRRTYFASTLKRVLEEHQCTAYVPRFYLEDANKEGLEGEKLESQMGKLYDRLWVDLRESASHLGSFSLLRRYWVMAATYDGLAAASVLWALVVATEPPFEGTGLAFWGPLVASLSTAVLAYSQGQDFFKTQIFELVATLAAAKERLIPEVPS